jgi:hypothetical protein
VGRSSTTRTVADKKRSTSLGPHDVFLLDQWGRQLYEAFGATAYLVGSVTKGKVDYRDVDVRMLDPLKLGNRPLARRTLNVAVSLWGRQVTGLPIDFQFQISSEFHEYDGEARNPMGTRSRRGWT